MADGTRGGVWKRTMPCTWNNVSLLRFFFKSLIFWPSFLFFWRSFLFSSSLAWGVQGQSGGYDEVVQVADQDWMECELVSHEVETAQTDSNPHHNKCPVCMYMAGKIYVAHSATPGKYHKDQNHACAVTSGICSCTCSDN